ncbi:DNA cytosine methyltransferase [Gracilibacillus oryzae]|uniref:Cytosine-specific methyltransferase n=1 Tax=Gracilibacillus oryzae TaxID=1672701 RepID=A0A7C8KPH4_9BACI|nr:DNA cytosine methyltransferase [Gracilibacillus oryzae]KAB8125585.1 DNA cytosine methyltransferase [Gracilibacillus oryzae]
MRFFKGELFSGPGGMSMGAKEASVTHPKTGEVFFIEHRWSKDFDSDTCKTFGKNICGDEEDPSVHLGPVEKLPIGNRDLLPDIDCLTFGFPCNDYSQVGKRHGLEGEYGPLYSYGVKAIKEYQPKFFVAENVGGLQSANEGKAFIQILSEMEECGYNLTPHLYKFEEYGIPQARHRIIIVGIRQDLYESGVHYKVPAPTTPHNYRTSLDAIINPPISDSALNHEFPRHSQKVKDMLSYIPAGANAWHPGIPKELQLKVKGVRISSIYKRLDPERPAYTVTGSGGGGTHMYHWNENRALTNRERARLQTFDDGFEFIGSKVSVRKQIGMAVPVKGAKVIFEAILKTFAGIEYNYVDPEPKVQLGNLVNKKSKNEIAKELTALV